MNSVSVIPTATVSRVGKNQVITPPPAAPPLLAPVTCCPSISMARVSVRTHLDPAMPVAAVGDTMLPLQLLRQLYDDISVFRCQIFTELRHSAGRSQDIWRYYGWSSHNFSHRSLSLFSFISSGVLYPSSSGSGSLPSLVPW